MLHDAMFTDKVSKIPDDLVIQTIQRKPHDDIRCNNGNLEDICESCYNDFKQWAANKEGGKNAGA